jgi:hypothetical protein
MAVAFLDLVAGDPALEQLSPGVRVEIDVFGVGQDPQRGRLQIGPGVPGDPAERVVHLQPAALHVDESHPDRGVGERALEAGMHLVQPPLGRPPLVPEPLVLGDPTTKFRVGHRERLLRSRVLAEHALHGGAGSAQRGAARAEVPLQTTRSAAQGLSQTLQPAACFRDPLAPASGRAVPQRRAGKVELVDPGGDASFEARPYAPDRGFCDRPRRRPGSQVLAGSLWLSRALDTHVRIRETRETDHLARREAQASSPDLPPGRAPDLERRRLGLYRDLTFPDSSFAAVGYARVAVERAASPRAPQEGVELMPVDSRDSAETGVRWPAVAMAVALAAVAGACGGSSSTDTTTTPTNPTLTTVTLTGTLLAGGAAFHSFTVAQQGTLTATLTNLTPQATITVGFGIGQPTGTTCTLLSTLETAKVGSVLSGTIAVGSFCIQIYDIGNVQGSDDYTITLVHP